MAHPEGPSSRIAAAVRLRVLVAASLGAFACLLAPAVAGAAQPGALSPLTGAQGCWGTAATTIAGVGPACGVSPTIDGASATATSPDGKNVYVAGAGGSYLNLTVFRRKRVAGDEAMAGETGSLQPMGCFNDNGDDGCTTARALRDPYQVAVSADGLNVYVGNWEYSAIVVFARNPSDGSLTQLAGPDGCVSHQEWSVGDNCTLARGIQHLSSIVASDDGRHVYTTAWSSHAVAVFNRKRAEDPGPGQVGALTQPSGLDACWSEDGSSGCRDGRGLSSPVDVAVAPGAAGNNPNVYVASHHGHSVAGFARNGDGTLTQLADEDGCIRNDASDNRCADGKALGYPRSIAVSPDGENIYVGASDGIAIIDRRDNGAMRQDGGPHSCWTYFDPNGVCHQGRGLYDASEVAVSPDGRSVYATSINSHDGIASYERLGDGTLRRLAGQSACLSFTGGFYNPHGSSTGACARFDDPARSEALKQGDGHALSLSPDGRNVYLAGRDSWMLAVLRREAAPGPGQPTSRVWDFAEDVRADSASDNPSDDRYGNPDVWHFGFWSTTADGADRTGAFTPYNERLFGEGGGVRGWKHNDRSYGSVEAWDFANGYLHTENGRANGIGWKNPYGSAVTVTIAGQVHDINNGGDGVTWHLAEDDTTIRTRTLTAGGDATPFEIEETVAAGATIWFVVAPRGNIDYDGTEYDLRITGPVDAQPQTTITGGPRGLNEGRTHSFNLSSSGAADTTAFQCRLDGGAWEACGGTAPSYPRAHQLTGLTDGPHTFQAKAVDGANEDPTPATRTFAIDDTDPETTLTGGPNGRTRDTTARFAFGSNEAGRLECRLDGTGATGWERCFSPVTLTELSEGAHTFQVRAIDSAGNVDQVPATRAFTVNTSPAGLQPGALTQLRGLDGCSSNTGLGGACRDDRRLDGASEIVVSPDGLHAYAAGHNSHAIVVYDRGANGALTQKAGAAGCVSYQADDGCAAAGDRAYHPWDIAISPDGKHVYVTNYYSHIVSVFDRAANGTLTAREEAAACIGDGEREGCAPGRALVHPRDLTFDPAGRTLYVTSAERDTVAVIDRDPVTGNLSQPASVEACWSWSGGDGHFAPNRCRDGRVLNHPRDVKVSPDGKNVYVAALESNAVVAFRRTTTGTPVGDGVTDTTLGDLQQLGGEDGCVVNNAETEGCRRGRAMQSIRSVAISVDGENVYTASWSDGLAALERNDRNGALSQSDARRACYLPHHSDSCEQARGLNDAESVAISPDDRTVYVGSSSDNGVSILRRDADGVLVPLTGRDACWTESGNYSGYDRTGACRQGKALNQNESKGVMVSPDGQNVYVGSYESDAVAVFRRSVPVSETEPQPLEWDAANDFVRAAPGANPGPDAYGHANVWTYGRGRTAADRLDDSFRTDGPGHLREGWLEPDQDYFGAGIDDYGRFHMHPDEQGDPIVVGWTNPLSTTEQFEIHALVQDNQHQGYSGDGVDWHIERGTTRLADGTVAAGAAAQAVDISEPVAPGETVWFTLERRANWTSDSTYFDIHIATDEAEPGPQTTINAGPRGLTKQSAPSFTFSSNTPTGSIAFECRLDAEPEWEPCGGAAGSAYPRTETLSALGNGPHTFRVRAKTTAATPQVDTTPATRTFTVDAAAPTVAFTAAPSGTTRDPAPRFEWTASEPGITECRLDPPAGASADAGFEQCFSPRQLPELDDGAHTFQVRAIDRAGNAGSPASRTFSVDTGAASLQPGALSQLQGLKGCVSETGTLPGGATCTDGKALDQPSSGAMTSDGRFLYVASTVSDAVSVFERAPATGQLTQVGCVSETGSGGDCTDARAVDNAYGVAVSPDDRFVYVISHDSQTLAAFERLPNGMLDQLDAEQGCFRLDSTVDGCTSVHGMYGPTSLAIAPDGKSLYVSWWHDYGGVTVFRRTPATGALVQPGGSDGCVNGEAQRGCEDIRAMHASDNVVVSPDGKMVYASGHHSHSVVALARDADGNLEQLAGELGCVRRDGGEGCTPVRSMFYPRRLAMAPDGANVYVASEGDYALVTLRTEPDGSLTQEAGADGCYRYDGSDGCADGERLNQLTGVEISADGRNVYAASHGLDALTAFSRDADGRLRQLGGVDACWTQDGAGGRCRDGKGLDLGWGENIVIAPDGAHVYALGWTDDDVAAFARKAPRPLTQPGDLVWDLAADWRHGADAENPLRDRFGNANVWQFRGANGATRAPGADGTGFVTLNPPRDFGYYCHGRGFGETAGDDFPLVKMGCDGGRVSVHPEANGRAVVTGWRNPLPAAATVNVSGLVQDNIEGNGTSNGIDWFLERGDLAAGGEQLAAGTLLNGGRGQNFDVTTEIAAGEFLWLSIDPRGSADYDMTHVDMTVSGPQESGPQTFVESGPRTVTTQARPVLVVGSDQAAAEFACRVGGTGEFTAAACGDATALPDVTGDGLLTRKRLELPAPGDGVRTVEVRATAASATDPTPAKRTFTIDSTAPQTTIEVGKDGLTRDRTPTFEFSLAPVETGNFFECRVGETGAWTRCTSPYTLPELSDGTHVFEVRAVDRIGNRDATPERRELQVDTSAAGIQFGALTQLAGTAGCFSQTGTLGDGACLDGRDRMDQTMATVVHPSGDFVFSASYGNDTVTYFRRAAGGALTRIGCVSRTEGEDCTVVRGLDGPNTMTFDDAGEHLYVTAHDNHAVTQLDFDPGGAGVAPSLTQDDVQATCLSRSDGGCLPGVPGLHYPSGIEVSPDGEWLYVASSHDNAVAVLDRHPATGRLTVPAGAQERCVSWGGGEGCRSARSLDDPQDIVAIDDFVYVASYSSHAVSVFKRNAQGGLEQLAGENGCVRDERANADGCRAVRGTAYARSIDASPNGEHVYVAGDHDYDRVAVLRRDAETGALTQATNSGACVARTGTGEDNDCDNVHDFDDPIAIRVAPDGRHVYVATRNSNSIVVLRRSADGSLRQLSGLDGCWSDTGNNGRCRNGKGLNIDYGPDAIAASADNASVYVAGRESDALAAFARRVPRASSAVGVWDVAEDFDQSAVGANPAPDRGGNSDVWTYLRGNGGADGTGRNPSTYAAFDQHLTDHRGVWRPLNTGEPAVWLSRQRTFNTHPANGAGGAPGVVRWRNPSTETISVQLQLQVHDDNAGCGDGVRWIAERGSLNRATGVVTGVQSLGGGRILNGGAAQSIERTLTVAPNDIVDLVVTNRTGEYSCDATRIDWEMRALPLTATEILEAPAALTNDETPSFKLDSTEQGATLQCAVRAGTDTATPANDAFVPCAKDHTLAALADGRYVFFARSVVAGTPEARPAWHRFKVDSTEPAPALTAPVADTSDTTPPVAGTAGDAADSDASSADSATVVVKIYRPAHGGDGETLMDTRTLTRSGTAFGPADIAASLPAGRYVARAEQEDAAGNKGVSADRTFRVDTTRPVTTITAPTQANASPDGRPTIRGTAGTRTGAAIADPAQDVHAADETTVTVALFEGSSTNNPPAGCPAGGGSCSFTGTVAPDGTFSATLPNDRTALADGTYTARVVQRDVAGNESVAVTRIFKVDTVAPTVVISDFPNALTRDRTPVFRGTAGSNLGTDPSQSADSQQVRLRLFRGTDADGEEVDMDPADPDVDRITVNRENTQFAFESELMPAGAFPDLADGTYTAVAEQLDLAGNAGRSAPVTFKVDTAPPRPTSDTPAAATNDRTPDLGGVPGVATGSEPDKAQDLFPVSVVLHRGTTLAGEQVDLRPGHESLAGQGTRVAALARWSLTVPADLADGTYTFRADQSDLAGNDGPGNAHAFKLDATPPSPAVATVPEKTKDRTPALSGTGGTLDGTALDSVADDGSVTVKVTRTHGDAFEKTFTATVNPATGAWSGSPADDLPDGTYRVTVLQEDALDNPGAGEGANLLKVDATAPLPTLADPATPTDDRTPQLSGTYERRDGTAVDSVADVAAVEVVVTRTHGAAFEETYQADEVSGGWTAGVTHTLTDGTYSAVAYQEDELGNRRATAAKTFKVDDTAPAPAVDAVATETSDRTPAFAGAAGSRTGTELDAVADAAQVTVVVERTSAGEAVRRELTPAVTGGGWTATIPGASELPDGTYRVTVAQTDALNNDSGPLSARTFKVDATAPVPTVAASVAGATRDRSPAITGTRGTQEATDSAVADRATLTVEIDPVAAGAPTITMPVTDATADAAWTREVDQDLPDGSYDVTVVQRDLLDNAGQSTPARRLKVDATAPQPTLSTITTPSNVRRPTLSGTRGTQGDTDDAVADVKAVEVEIDPLGPAAPYRQTVADDDGTAGWSAQLDSALGDGSYDVRVLQVDALGNEDASAVRRIKVDGTAPSPAVTSAPSTTSDRTPALSGTGGRLDGSALDSAADDGSVTVKVTRTHGDAFERTFTAAVDPATGAWSGSPAQGLTDGTYRVTVLQEDALDNPGSGEAGNLMKVDATAPAPTLAAVPAATADRTPSFTGAYDRRDGTAVDSVADVHEVDVVVSRTHGAPFTKTYAASESDGTWTVTTGDELADGTYTVAAVQEDALGNRRASAEQTVKVDGTAPEPTVDEPAAETSDRTPTLSGDAGSETGADVDAVADDADVRVTLARTAGGPAANIALETTRSGGRWTATVPQGDALGDGTWRVTVAQADALDNTHGVRSPRTFKVDGTQPAPTVDAPASSDTRDRRPTFTGTRGTQAATDSAVADRDALTLEADPVKAGEATQTRTFNDDAGATWSAQLAGDLPDGTYDVTVLQRDLLDNEGRSTPARRIRVDRTAPAPTLAALPAATRDRTPALSGTRTARAADDDGVADAAALTIEIDPVKDGVATRTQTIENAAASWSTDVASDLPDGSYDIRVLQSDVLGNEGASEARRIKVDATAPVPSLTAPTSPTRDRTPTLSGARGTRAADDDGVADTTSLTLEIDPVKAGVASRTQTVTDGDATAAWAADVAQDLPDGSYDLRVLQADALGNEGASDVHRLKVDQTAPQPTVTSPALTNSRTPTISGQKGADVGDDDRVDDAHHLKLTITRTDAAATPIVLEFTDQTGTGWSKTVPAADALADGTYSAVVEQADSLGNTTTSSAHAFKVDATKPAPTVDAGSAATKDDTPSFSGDAGTAGTTATTSPDLAPITVSVRRKGSEATPVTQTVTAAAGRWSATVGELDDGTYLVTASQTDTAGNTGESAAREIEIDTVAPEMTFPQPSDTKALRPTFSGTGGRVSGSADDAVADGATVQLSLAPVGDTPGEILVTEGTVGPDGTWTAQFGQDLVEGRHVVTASQDDAVGNQTSVGERYFDVDRTAPAVTLDDLGTTPTSDGTPTLSGNGGTLDGAADGQVADARAVFVELSRGAVKRNLQTSAGNDGRWTITVPDEQALTGDGTWTATVTQEDVLGNARTVTDTLVLDTTPAETTIADKPAAFTNDDTPRFRFTANETVDRFECAIDSTGDYATCAADGSLAHLADGEHTLRVRAVDLAGNVEQAVEAHTFTVDTDRPETYVTDGPPAGFNKDPQTFAVGSDEPEGDTFECRVVGPGAANADTPFTSCGDTKTYTALADGSYRFEVRATDRAGNVDETPATHAFKVDNTVPDTTLADGFPAEHTDDSTPKLRFSTTADDLLRFECRVDGTGDGGWATCADGDDLASLQDGTHKVEVRAVDQALNADLTPATRTFTVDTIDPGTTIGEKPAGVVKARTARFTFSSNEEHAKFECRLDDAVAFTECPTPHDLSNLDAGPHTLRVQAFDRAGNRDPDAEVHEWVVDLTAPAPTVTAPAAGGTGDAKPQFAGAAGDAPAPASDKAAITIDVFSGTGTGGTRVHQFTTSRTGAAWSFTPESALPDGTYTVRVVQEDLAGNSGTSNERTFKVDTAKPVVGWTTTGGDINDPTPTLRGTSGAKTGSDADAVADGAVTVQVTGATGYDETFTATRDGGTFELTVPDGKALADGTYTATVRQADAVGNAADPVELKNLRVDTAAPNVTLTEPPAATKDTTPSFSGGKGTLAGTPSRSQDGAVALRLYRGTGTTEPLGDPVAAESDGASWSVEWPAGRALADGTYTAVAEQRDGAGNVGHSTPARTFIVDTAKPAPAFAASTGRTRNTRPALGGTLGALAGDLAQIDLRFTKSGAQAVQLTDAGAGGTWSLDAADWAEQALSGDGDWTVTITQRDQAGNEGTATRTLTLDTAGPATVIESGPAGTTNQTTAQFGLDTAAADLDRFECRLDPPAENAPWTACAALSGLADGAHTFEARAVDDLGNTGAKVTRTWTVASSGDTATSEVQPGGTVANTTPAGAATVKWPAADTVSVKVTQTDAPDAGGFDFAGYRVEVDPAGSHGPFATPIELVFEIPAAQMPGNSSHQTLTVFRDGQALPECAAGQPDAAQKWCVKTREPLSGGARITVHTLEASTWTFGEDVRPPAVQVTDGPAGESASRDATFRFTVDEPGSATECRMDGGAFAPCASPKTYTGLGEGARTFEVRATDRAGNESRAGRAFTIRLPKVDPPAPPVEQPKPPADQPAPPATPAATKLTDAAMKAMAQRVLKSPAIGAIRGMTLGDARAFGSAAVASGKVTLKRGRTRAPLFAIVCAAQCSVAVTERLTVGAKKFTLTVPKMTFAGAGAGVVELRLSAAAAKALAKARKAKLSVAVEVADAAGKKTRAVKQLSVTQAKK